MSICGSDGRRSRDLTIFSRAVGAHMGLQLGRIDMYGFHMAPHGTMRIHTDGYTIGYTKNAAPSDQTQDRQNHPNLGIRTEQ